MKQRNKLFNVEFIKIKCVPWSVILLLIISTGYAQRSNHAWDTNGNAINFGDITELNSTQHFTFEAWIKIDTWVNRSTIFHKRGNNRHTENIDIQLGDHNRRLYFHIANGTNNVISLDNALPNNHQWYHVALVYDGTSTKKLRFYRDGVELVSSNYPFPTQTPSTSGTFMVAGNGFDGKIDEVRLWRISASTQEIKNRFKGTINNIRSDYSDLIGYWNFDFDMSFRRIVDETNTYPGSFSSSPSPKHITVTDNDYFFYRKVITFVPIWGIRAKKFTQFQAPHVNRVIYSGQLGCTANGNLFDLAPDNDASMIGSVNYLSNFSGRNDGVLDFPGHPSAYMQASNAHSLFFFNAGASDSTAESRFSFAAWIYIDTWKADASIVSKRQDENHRVQIQLGPNDGHNMLVFYVSNGSNTSFSIHGALQTGQWHHIGLAYNGETSINSDRLKFYVDGIEKTLNIGSNTIPTKLPNISSDIEIGRGFDGKMDEIRIYPGFWGQNQFTNLMNNNFINNEGYVGWNTRAYWPIQGGTSSAGIDYGNWKRDIERIRAINVLGQTITLGIGAPSLWPTVVADAKARTTLANELATFVNGVSDFIGVDVDFEYPSDTTGANLSQFLVQLRAHMPDKEISTGIGRTNRNQYNLTAQAIDAVDGVTIRTYQERVSNWPSTLQKLLNHGYPRKKLWAGFGSYGWKKKVSDPGPREIFYNNILTQTAGTSKDVGADGSINNFFINGTEYIFSGRDEFAKLAQRMIDDGIGGVFEFTLPSDQTNFGPVALWRSLVEVMAPNNGLSTRDISTISSTPSSLSAGAIFGREGHRFILD